MKKALFFGLIIVPVLMTALLWAVMSDRLSCSKDTSSVTVMAERIALVEVSFASSRVDVQIQVANDNAEVATLERLEYDIYLGYQNKWYWLGRGEKGDLEIGANDSSDFMISTDIDNSRLRNIATERILGTEPTEMKVEGQARFEVGEASVELEFDGKDVNPYEPLPEDKGTIMEPVEAGTKGALSE